MEKNPYIILGIDQNATEDEAYDAYRKKRAELNEQIYQPGEAGAQAARKITELDQAYEDVRLAIRDRGMRAEGETNEGYSSLSDIEKKIKDGKLSEAQQDLDNITDRSAEWHYLQSIIYYRKNWYAESKRQLEFACQQEPTNTKYSDALLRLNNLINTNKNRTANAASGNAGGGAPSGGKGEWNHGGGRQMGGGCNECDCCTSLLCADCCCEMMGGDFIACC